MSKEDGRAAVSLARAAIDDLFGIEHPPLARLGAVFSERRGVFVTLNLEKSTNERLRGCIGFPYPVKTLRDAIQEAAVAAATEDPRFVPVTRDELGDILVEVSILTIPTMMEGPTKDRPKHVRIGEDGLMVSNSYLSGLLLPQVATEFRLGQEDFLSQACLKAGLPPDAWLDSGTQVQVFQAEIFAEKTVRGEVARVDPRDL